MRDHLEPPWRGVMVGCPPASRTCPAVLEGNPRESAGAETWGEIAEKKVSGIENKRGSVLALAATAGKALKSPPLIWHSDSPRAKNLSDKHEC